jgi:phosphohistidine phosphatase
MQLLLVRHAIAEDRERFAASGRDDCERPLTAEGRRRMKAAATGLARLVPRLEMIATSPYSRARETGDIISGQYRGAEILETDVLKPGSAPEAFLDFLQLQAGHPLMAAVGHEPDLGRLGSWLLTGQPLSFLEFKKGAACLIEFDGRPWPGAARLVWALTPRQLRGLAR